MWLVDEDVQYAKLFKLKDVGAFSESFAIAFPLYPRPSLSYNGRNLVEAQKRRIQHYCNIQCLAILTLAMWLCGCLLCTLPNRTDSDAFDFSVRGPSPFV